MAVMLENRVIDLEQLMAQLTQNVDRLSREMQDFKDEMREFNNESRRRWGELANKLGTMAEDLVVPSIPRGVTTLVNCLADRISSAVRVKRRNAERQLQEFDVVATCDNYLFLNETKSKLSPEDVKAFAEEILPAARDFFPEYADKQVIGIVASLYVDESLVHYAERQGLVVLGFGEDVMDVLNSPDFVPKTW
jgi:hypothetical protein